MNFPWKIQFASRGYRQIMIIDSTNNMVALIDTFKLSASLEIIKQLTSNVNIKCDQSDIDAMVDVLES